MEEYFFQCPYCWQEVSILIDKSVSKQSFIEDCEVCCRPIQFEFEIEEGEVVSFEVKNLEE